MEPCQVVETLLVKGPDMKDNNPTDQLSLIHVHRKTTKIGISCQPKRQPTRQQATRWMVDKINSGLTVQQVTGQIELNFSMLLAITSTVRVIRYY